MNIIIVICELSYLRFGLYFRLYHMTYKFDSVIHDLAVCKNFVNIVTFGLSVTCTYWTLLNACVKKDEHLENQKYYLNQK